MKNFLLRHFLPLIAAAGVSISACKFFPEYFRSTDATSVKREYDPQFRFERHHYTRLSEDPAYEADFYQQWLPVNPMVVIGSSEMTRTDYKMIPYNFFTNNRIPCVGFGASGNQSLNILTQLSVMKEQLHDMKLVIVLSPGWFDGEYCSGTPLETFLAYNNEHMLYQLNDNFKDYPEDDPAIKAKMNPLHYIEDYVSENLEAINSPSSMLRLMAYRSRERNVTGFAYAPFVAMHSTYSEFKQTEMQKLFSESKGQWPFAENSLSLRKSEAQFQPLFHFDFDSTFNAEQTKFVSEITNNEWYIEDKYYTDWIAGKALKRVSPVAEDKNQELQDFKVLVQFLHQEDCNVLFVIQAYNPFCFENLAELDPTIDIVRNEIHENGFEVFDMYTSDTKKFIPGILSDLHHMSEAGWTLVDKAIEAHFFPAPPKMEFQFTDPISK